MLITEQDNWQLRLITVIKKDIKMIIDPSELSGRDAYQLLVGLIVPRPIAFVSTVSEAGIFNAAPFSFFTGISAKPPMICFSPARKRVGAKKDTWTNIEITGDFVVNVVTESIAEQMNVTAAEYPEGVSEFDKSGLTPILSEKVKSPRIKESPIHMECKLIKIIEFEQTTGALVIGEVVLFHIQNELIDANYKIDTRILKPVGRLGGMDYNRVNDIFEMERAK